GLDGGPYLARNSSAHCCCARMMATISSSIKMVSGAPSIFVLLVAQFRDERAWLWLALWILGWPEGQQGGTVEHEDFAEPTPGAGQQHQDPHRLLIIHAAVGDRIPEQADPGHDLAECVIVDDVAVLRPGRWPGDLPAPEESGVLGPEREPR